MDSVITLILGGGKGTRLDPLTRERSKAAVPFGGMYRLIDIPISNSINSGFRKVFVLTQYNSYSLHNHITTTYQFDAFNQGYVKILAAEQTPQIDHFHQGTADAVRKAFDHLQLLHPEHYMILSGDQLYRMDFRQFLQTHKDRDADVTVACTPIGEKDISQVGLLKVRKDGTIEDFLEKPQDSNQLEDWQIPSSPPSKRTKTQVSFYGSMGIYLFKAKVLKKLLASNKADFGKEIIPEGIKSGLKVQSYLFKGFWQDLGTLSSFYEANLSLAHIQPKYNLYDSLMPIYTRYRYLPPSKLNFCTISQSLCSDGCILTNATILNSVIGVRSVVDSDANLEGVIMMGSDFYENDRQKKQNYEEGIPHIGIGRGTVIKKAIIDKNARIGDGCRIGTDDMHRPDGDMGSYSIRSGIIVIRKNGVIPAGTVI